jgi:hypothetical protein
MLFRLVTMGLSALHDSEPNDTLQDFIVRANADEHGNLLDNLVLADKTYMDLRSEGWEPDRWEIENAPMTISLLLEFLRGEELTPKHIIDARLEISLREAQENYRYSGSPFEASADSKTVTVQAPGWEYRGKQLIRPKVREISRQSKEQGETHHHG